MCVFTLGDYFGSFLASACVVLCVFACLCVCAFLCFGFRREVFKRFVVVYLHAAAFGAEGLGFWRPVTSFDFC